MIPTENDTKTPPAATGLFALLSNKLRALGTSAPKIVQGTGAPVRLLLGILATSLVALAISAAPALAGTGHGFTGLTIGEQGTGAGQLEEPAGVAVSDATTGPNVGDVYVVDKGNNRIDEFESDGAFIRAWGWEVDRLPGFGTCTTITTCQAGSAGSGAGQLDFPYAIAVDNSGSASDSSKEDVYVTNTADNVIEKFSATGAYISELTETTGGSLFGGLLGVAVDPKGSVWVYENEIAGNGEVAEFSDTGSFEKSFNTGRGTNPGLAVNSSDNVYLVPGSPGVSKWDPATATETTEFSENVRALAIDSATNDLLIDHGSSIAEWSLVEPYEKPVEEFASKQLTDGAGAGVAVGSATGAVYVADAAGDKVDVFTEGPTPSEAPLTKAASGETGSSAVLHGELDPGGATGALEYQFDYNTGASCTGGQSTPVPAVKVAEAKEAAVQATATNLEPDAQYTYCLVALNTFGEVRGNEVPFTTLKVPPTAKTEPATSVKSTEARLEGLVNPNNQSTKCEFQYGAEASLGTSTTVGCEPETLTGLGEQGVGLTVSALTQNATYYYRVIAESAPDEKAEGTIEHFTTPIHPETPEKLSASPVAATEATLHGTLNPKAAGNPGSYEFLYKASATQCEGGESSGGSALGGSGEAVKAEITGLIPNTAYTFCLRAHNEAGEESTLSSPVTFTTPPAVLVIKSESSSDLSSTEARLEAEINPGNSETAYHFEYGPTAGSYDVSVPVPDAHIHAGLTSVSVSAVATDLTPSTIYHYRVVAANALPGVVEGPDQTFTTLASVGTGSPLNCPNAQLRAEQPSALELPDCRAYEMVSPLDKNDSDAVNEGSDSIVRASLAGEAITYNAYGAFAEPAGSQYESQYLSSRGSAGWSTKNITPPYKAHQTTLYSAYRSLAFTPELSAGITETDVPLTSEALPEVEDLYVADLAGASYQLVSSNGNNSAHSAETPEVVGASNDLSHILFEDAGKIYEWADGRLSVINEGMNAAAGGGSEYEAEGSAFWRAMSDNGARVFMTSSGEFDQPNRQLYVRENPEQPQSPLSGEECTVPSDACTVEVSASQKTNGSDPHGPQSARYWGASVDGSTAFFTSCEKLTNEATAASLAATTEDPCKPGTPGVGNDLYEYDLEKPAGERLTDLTVNTKNTDGAGVLGVVDISEDGSYVYFVAEGELAADAVAGQPNLYLDHDGAVTFIATLKPGGKAYGQNPGDSSDWSNGDPALNTVRETPDGTHLAFLSSMSLTGYDNEQAATGECEEFEGEDGKCREIYEYDAGAGSESLRCVSCDPSGARPVGPSSFGDEEGNASSQREDYTPRSFSEDGSRLFFQSRDALVPQDSDGLQDVYEYEDGHVYPISDVTGGYESSFLDASASGNDVFIATTDQLLPQDTDFRTDVYDARVGGGYPISTSPPTCDSADACKAPVSPQPAVFRAPASSTFSGAGNLAPVVVVKPAVKPKAKPKAKQCRRGFVNKHGKCVKKKTKKKTSKSSRHSKKGRK